MAWIPKLPPRFGELPGGWDLIFQCRRGSCHRATRVTRAECIERWGKEGRVADVAGRMKCERCKTRGAFVSIAKGEGKVRTIGEQAREKLEPIDRLARDILDLKPCGEVR